MLIAVALTPYIVAGIASIGGIVSVVITHLLAKTKIAEIHVLVNSRLQAVLEQNKLLAKKIELIQAKEFHGDQ